MNQIPVLLDLNVTEAVAPGLFAALGSPRLEVLGISMVFGETDVDTSLRNTAGVLDLFGRDIEVALGARVPYMSDYAIQPTKQCLCASINGLQLNTDAPVNVSPLPASEFLYSKLTAAKERVTLLCAGPLTNIAHLLLRHPDAVDYIHQLVWCGGTQRHANIGMVKDKQTVMDPDAASLVMSYDLHFVVCPVDMGEKLCATKEEIDVGILAKDEISHQHNRLLKKLWCDRNAEQPLFQRSKPLPLQDVAAVRFVTDPELFETQGFFAEVDRKGRLTYGMFVVHCWNDEPRLGDEPNITLIRKVDREAAIQKLYSF